ncbi:MAG TPA: hypothetical protein VI322_04980 [Candidatus Saccharimonadia bacterium]
MVTPPQPDQLYQALLKTRVQAPGVSKPDPSVEEEVTKIYQQARLHRERLVSFYLWYTFLVTIAVLGLLYIQAEIRILSHGKFEIIQEWALGLLVTGMFGQFVGLLLVVTKQVWNYKEFLWHVRNHAKNSSTSDKS